MGNPTDLAAIALLLRQGDRIGSRQEAPGRAQQMGWSCNPAALGREYLI